MRMARVFTAAASALFLVAAGILPAQASPGEGTFVVTVTSGGAAVSGLRVYVSSLPADGDETFDSEHSDVGSTDKNGTFRTSLPADRYRVVVEPDLYDSRSHVPTWAPSKAREGDGKIYTLSAGKTTKVGVRMLRGGTITGTLRNANGTPASGFVYVEGANNPGLSSVTALASKGGRFTVRDLPTGSYRVTTLVEGHEYLRGSKGKPSRVSVVAGKTTSIGRLSLPKTGSLQVSLPVKSGGSYSLYHAGTSRAFVVDQRLPRSGRIAERGVPAGRYDVYVLNRGVVATVTVKAGRTTTKKVTRLKAQSKVTGTLKARDGTPVKRGTFVVTDSKGRVAARGVVRGGVFKERFASAAGFRLPAGKFAMEVLVGAMTDPPSLGTVGDARISIVASSGKKTTLAATLPRVATVTGRVMSGGAPVGSVEVWLGAAAMGSRWTVTTADGRFRFDDVRTGTHKVYVTERRLSHGLLARWSAPFRVKGSTPTTVRTVVLTRP